VFLGCYTIRVAAVLFFAEVDGHFPHHPVTFDNLDYRKGSFKKEFRERLNSVGIEKCISMTHLANRS